MIIVRLKGGLGNQLFQYAFARALSIEKSEQLTLDTSHFMKLRKGVVHRPYELASYNIKAKIGLSKLRKIQIKMINRTKGSIKKICSIVFSITVIKEQKLSYDDSVKQDFHGICFYDGYWQSELYFKQHRKILLKELHVAPNLNSDDKVLMKKISDSESIAVHIRRGDYIANAEVSSVHGVSLAAYYIDAIKWMRANISNPAFYIFSDDPVWVAQHYHGLPDVVIAANQSLRTPQEDLYLMSVCKHQIIANSSFSWWAAWLNENQNKKIIAPSQWFKTNALSNKDLIPDDWIRI